MKRFPSLVLLLLAVASLVVACSSSSAKRGRPETGDAGAAGEQAAAGSSGTIEQAGAGGSGGTSEAGAAGTAEAGAGGEGLPPLSLAVIAGEWTGTLMNTYVCESSPSPITLTIEGTSITTSPWPLGDGATGPIEQQEGGAFTFAVDVEPTEYIPVSSLRGQLFVDPTATYALLVTQEFDDRPHGNIALLQRGGEQSNEVGNADLVGVWTGTGVRLNNELAVTESFESSAVISEGVEDALELAGTDVDGSFLSQGLGSNESSVWASEVSHQDTAFGGVFLLSPDKRVLASALIKDVSENNGPLCDLYVFADMSVHKFALWTRSAAD